MQNFFWLLIVFLLEGINFLNAQHYSRITSIPVKENGSTLSMPWSGGHNSVQLSEIDINQDGIKDLFVFDRTGNKITCYINKGIADSVCYVDSTEKYASHFPHLESWALLRDFNCDGKMDIFTYAINTSTIKVWKNISTPGNLQFALQSSGLISSYCPTVNYLYTSAQDIPAIDDVDGDGDLDILTFGAGYSMEFHINKSVEKGYTCDSLIYQKDCSSCWGHFMVNSSCTPSLLSCRTISDPPSQDSTDANQKIIPPVVPLNGGECTLCLDLDGDGDKDIVYGKLGCCNLTQLTNSGTKTTANITAFDSNFPSYDLPASLTSFPCGFFVDVNNDGKRDLIVSPNSPVISIDKNSLWYYENTGTDSAPVFKRRLRNFLQADMIDVGTGADPAFFDFNSDGLTDLLISNYRMQDDSCPATSSCKVMAYQNTGTVLSPAFRLVNTDFANLSAQLPSVNSMHLTFGDVDGDGDQDLFVGDLNGNLHFLLNTAGAGNPSNFALQSPFNFQDASGTTIDIGSNATPQLIDVDRDGDLDLIIGTRSGNIVYYKNIGTPTTLSYSLITSSFGGIDVLKSCCTGYSVPFMYDSAGSYQMIIGSEASRDAASPMGWLWYYKNIDGNLGGNFSLVDSMYQKIWEGIRMTVTGKDITGDGRMDLVIGNYAGGVTFYKGDTLTTGVFETPAENYSVNIYPNPSNGKFTIQPNSNLPFANSQIEVYNIFGECIHRQIISSSICQIDLSSQPNGIYYCKLSNEKSSFTKKIIVIK